MLTAVTWPLEIDRKPHVDYLKGLWGSLEGYTRGYYMNEVADEAQSIVDNNYQGNIGRMREVKKQYDPMNLFRLNANVLPAEGPRHPNPELAASFDSITRCSRR
jgi:hypothetical protein